MGSAISAMKIHIVVFVACTFVAVAAGLVETELDHADHAIGGMEVADAMGALEALGPLDGVEDAPSGTVLLQEDDHDRRDDHDDEERGEDANRDSEKGGDEDVSDVGETDTDGATAKTTDTTQGMFDAEVRVNRAFASMDDEMASLSSAIAGDDTKSQKTKKGDAFVQLGDSDDSADDDSDGQGDSEDEKESGDEGEAADDSQDMDLGDSDGVRMSDADVATATTDTTEGMYDAETRAERAMSSFDDAMSGLDMAMAGDEPDNKAEEPQKGDSLLQTAKSDKFGLDSDEQFMTAQNSVLADAPVTERASAEMQQWDDMSGASKDDNEALQAEASAEGDESKYAKAADPIESTIVDEEDDQNKKAQLKESNDDLVSIQKKEQDAAMSFVKKQRQEENAILAKAEMKEKKKEEKATKEVMGEIGTTLKTVKEAGQWHMKKAV